MSEIQLPQELQDRVVTAMIDSLLKDGLTYNLRAEIEARFKEAMAESGIIENIANSVITEIKNYNDSSEK